MIVPLMLGDYNSGKLDVYPVPATNRLSFETDMDVQQVRLMNLQGQEVMTRSGQVSDLNVSGLATGMYVLETKSGDAVLRKRVQISR